MFYMYLPYYGQILMSLPLICPTIDCLEKNWHQKYLILDQYGNPI